MSGLMRVLFLVLVLAFAACGDDTGPPPVINNGNGNNVNNTNNTNNLNNSNNSNNSNNLNNEIDMGEDTDMPDADADLSDMTDMSDMDPEMCPMTPCGADEICVDGACLVADSCISAFDFGVLASGSTVMREGSFVTEGTDTIGTTCAGPDASRERVFRFELTQESSIIYQANWVGQFDGVLEFRTTCEDAVGIERCTDAESGTIILGPGVYFLILEVKLGNPGDYELQLTANATSCTIGSRECQGNTVAECVDGTMQNIYQCTAGCNNGICEGDSCSMPVTIAANGGTYTGDGLGYFSNLNYVSNLSCNSTATPGYDLVFYLPTLTAGQIITIDALTGDTNSNAIFVQSVCGDTEACLAAFDVNEDVDFVVPSDGDYYVVVDKLLQSGGPFNYTVTVSN